MFSFFERLVDPYGPYAENDTPPKRLFAFLFNYAQPFKRVFWAAGTLSVIIAANRIVSTHLLLWLVMTIPVVRFAVIV